MTEAMNFAEARMQAEKAEVAQQVREAIAQVPLLQGTTLEVDE